MTDMEDTLENIEKLLALNIAEDKTEEKAIQILLKVDYTHSEIGEIIGRPEGTVSRKISEMKKNGDKDE